MDRRVLAPTCTAQPPQMRLGERQVQVESCPTQCTQQRYPNALLEQNTARWIYTQARWTTPPHPVPFVRLGALEGGCCVYPTCGQQASTSLRNTASRRALVTPVYASKAQTSPSSVPPERQRKPIRLECLFTRGVREPRRSANQTQQPPDQPPQLPIIHPSCDGCNLLGARPRQTSQKGLVCLLSIRRRFPDCSATGAVGRSVRKK